MKGVTIALSEADLRTLVLRHLARGVAAGLVSMEIARDEARSYLSNWSFSDEPYPEDADPTKCQRWVAEDTIAFYVDAGINEQVDACLDNLAST